ncbi:MAG: hypothetical protein AAF806_09390 [Bacteroidota bacterium]
MKYLTFLLLLLFCACSNFKEIHYIKDNAPDMPNYYRVKITGTSFISSSRYMSGYFDPILVQDFT